MVSLDHCILVVENDAEQRELISKVLREKLAFLVFEASGVEEAKQQLTCARKPDADIILYDISRAGSESVRELKVVAQCIPIVTLVNYGDYEVAMASIHAGAQDFLTKPAAIERIGTTFRNLLLLRDAARATERLRIGNNAESEDTQQSLLSLRTLALMREDGNVRSIQEIEAEAIRRAMQHYNGCLTEVARRLGIGRSTLYRKLNELSLRQTQAA